MLLLQFFQFFFMQPIFCVHCRWIVSAKDLQAKLLGYSGSSVASMEQMEQLLPRTAQTTFVIRADPMRFLGDWGLGVGQECGDGGATACQCLHCEQCHCHQTFLGLTRHGDH